MCHPRSMSSTLQAHLSASVKPGRSGRGAVGRPECLAGARPIPEGRNGQRRRLSGLAPCRRYYLGCPLSSDFLCQIGLEMSIYSLGKALGAGGELGRRWPGFRRLDQSGRMETLRGSQSSLKQCRSTCWPLPCCAQARPWLSLSPIKGCSQHQHTDWVSLGRATLLFGILSSWGLF